MRHRGSRAGWLTLLLAALLVGGLMGLTILFGAGTVASEILSTGPPDGRLPTLTGEEPSRKAAESALMRPSVLDRARSRRASSGSRPSRGPWMIPGWSRSGRRR